jgi:hypothetical protein
MVKELGSLRDEVRTLRDELKIKNVVIDKYEPELKRYRSVTFLEGGFEGAREYNQELDASRIHPVIEGRRPERTN